MKHPLPINPVISTIYRRLAQSTHLPTSLWTRIRSSTILSGTRDVRIKTRTARQLKRKRVAAFSRWLPGNFYSPTQQPSAPYRAISSKSRQYSFPLPTCASPTVSSPAFPSPSSTSSSTTSLWLSFRLCIVARTHSAALPIFVQPRGRQRNHQRHLLSRLLRAVIFQASALITRRTSENTTRWAFFAARTRKPRLCNETVKGALCFRLLQRGTAIRRPACPLAIGINSPCTHVSYVQTSRIRRRGRKGSQVDCSLLPATFAGFIAVRSLFLRHGTVS